MEEMIKEILPSIEAVEDFYECLEEKEKGC